MQASPPAPAQEESSGSILIVHGNRTTVDVLVSTFSAQYVVAFGNSASEASQLLKQGLQPSLVIYSPHLGGLDSGFMDTVREVVPDAVVLLTVDPWEMAQWAARTLTGGFLLFNLSWQKSDALQIVRLGMQQCKLRARRRVIEETRVREQTVIEKIRAEGVLVRRNLVLEGEHLAKNQLQLLAALGQLAGSGLPYHTPHGLYTAFVAKEIAAWLHMSEADTRFLVLAALLHDAGKAALPLALATADPASLAGADLALYQSHVAETGKLLAHVGVPAKVVDIVRQHHELCDGSGFPAGLSGADILPEAQILAVADVYHNGVFRFHGTVPDGGELPPQSEEEREERVESVLQWFRPREHLYSPHVVQGLFAVADHLHDPEFHAFAQNLPLGEWEPFFPEVAARRDAANREDAEAEALAAAAAPAA